MSNRTKRLKALGNAVVPACADQRRKDQKIANDIEDHAWAVYKGWRPETYILKRADPFAQGYSYGAGKVARKILEGA